MTWFDDGVRMKLFVSTDGDFVSTGTRTDYPFSAGGNNIPSGWTFFVEVGAIGDVNLTTAIGRWSVSNASPNVSHSGGKYTLYRDFPVAAGRSYLFNVQSQTMEGKTNAYRTVTYQLNGAGTRYGSQRLTSQGWEQISLPLDVLSGVTFVRILLAVNPYWADLTKQTFDWGVQYQNVAVVDMPGTSPAITWREITCDGMSTTFRYGRARFTSRYDVGTCQISLTNDDGEYTYSPDHPWGLRPGRFIRLVGTVPGSATQYPLFYGLIDSLSDGYGLDGKAVVNMSCVDTSSLLSNINVPTMSNEATTYYSGGRFSLLVRAAGWNSGMVQFDPGIFIQQPIHANGRTIRDELGLIADSEGSWFYCDQRGRLVYRDREAVATNQSWRLVQAELLAQCPEFINNVKMVLPGVDDNFLSIPHRSGFDVTNSIDLVAKVTMDDMTSEQTFWSKGASWNFRKLPNAKTLGASVGGATELVSTASLPYNNGATIWVRVQRDTSGNVRFYHSLAGDSDSIPSTAIMTQLGATLVRTNAIGVNTDPVRFGNRASLWQGAFKGRIWRAAFSAAPGGQMLVDIAPSGMRGFAEATQVPLTFGGTLNLNQTDGNVILQDDPTNPSGQLTIVDNVPTMPNPAIVELQALQTDWSRDRVVNDLQLANQGGSAFQVVDGESQRRYGPRTYQRLDFVNDNTHPEYLALRAQDIMTGFTDATLRVNQVNYRPNSATYGWTLVAFLNDLVRVRYTNRKVGWGYAVASHIQGIQHTITPRDWQVQLMLDDPEAFSSWGPPARGAGWDEATWDDDIWDGLSVGRWSAGFDWDDSITRWGA